MTFRPRLSVIGAGAWGINHVRVIASEASCVLASVADRDSSARERAAAFTASVVADPDQVFSDRSVDGVVIATPSPTHASLTRAALLAGKHVLVEKPAARSVEETQLIADATRESGRIFMAGHLMVFHSAVARLAELLHSSTLGELHYIHSTRANSGRIRRDESVLWSFGPHELSMLDHLLGQQPISVAARGQCIVEPGVEDVVFLTLRYARGEIAHLHLSRIHPRKERTLTLVCSQKMVEFDDVAPEKLRIYNRSDGATTFSDFAEYLTLRDTDVSIPTLTLKEPLRQQLLHFRSCIEHGQQPSTDLASTVRITTILEAAQASLIADGFPVNLKT